MSCAKNTIRFINPLTSSLLLKLNFNYKESVSGLINLMVFLAQDTNNQGRFSWSLVVVKLELKIKLKLKMKLKLKIKLRLNIKLKLVLGLG